jgi:hypothetical protein
MKNDKLKQSKKPGLVRVKTAGCLRREDDCWKENINQRLKNILATESKPDFS